MLEPEQSGAAESSETGWILPDADRLEALAEFAAGAGHEINNPLATIIGRAQQLLKEERDPQRRQMLQSIGAQAYRVRDMIGDTMLFARPPQPALQVVNLGKIVQDVVARLEHPLLQSGCSVMTQVAPELHVTADPVQLAIVISELIRNSHQALQPDGGPIQIRASASDGFIHLEVEDCGSGFSESDRQHAFDPFYSGRQAGRGLGFGLPKCWRILNQHGGRIEIASVAGTTIVRSEWPAA